MAPYVCPALILNTWGRRACLTITQKGPLYASGELSPAAPVGQRLLVSQYHRDGAKCGCAWSLSELLSVLSENRESGRTKSKKKNRKKTEKNEKKH